MNSEIISDPLTITALLSEAALFIVALAVLLVPGVVRPVRWLAHALALVSLLITLAAMASAIWELWAFRYPLARPEAPLGTYAQPTVLGVLGVVVGFLLVATGAVLAFRRPSLAGLLFVGSGVLTLLSVTRSRLQDPTFPPGNFTMAVLGVALPALAVGSLLLATWRAEQTRARRTRPSSTIKRYHGRRQAA